MISLIAAADHNRVIGRDGELPWHLPEDLKRFRNLTLEKPIIMGRRTHESIGKPLDKRTNIVLTTQPDFRAEGCQVVHTIKEAVNICDDAEEIMIIGGESIFQAFLPRADRLYLTIIHQTFEGDTYIPRLQLNEWFLTGYEHHSTDTSELPYSYFTLERETSEPLNWRELDSSTIPEFVEQSLREPKPAK